MKRDWTMAELLQRCEDVRAIFRVLKLMIEVELTIR